MLPRQNSASQHRGQTARKPCDWRTRSPIGQPGHGPGTPLPHEAKAAEPVLLRPVGINHGAARIEVLRFESMFFHGISLLSWAFQLLIRLVHTCRLRSRNASMTPPQPYLVAIAGEVRPRAQLVAGKQKERGERKHHQDDHDDGMICECPPALPLMTVRTLLRVGSEWLPTERAKTTGFRIRCHGGDAERRPSAARVPLRVGCEGSVSLDWTIILAQRRQDAKRDKAFCDSFADRSTASTMMLATRPQFLEIRVRLGVFATWRENFRQIKVSCGRSRSGTLPTRSP